MSATEADRNGPVLIAGSGYTGTRLAIRLAAAGRPVIALRRGAAAEPAGDAAAIEWLRCDLDAPPDLDRLAARLERLDGPVRVAYLVPPGTIVGPAGRAGDSRLAAFLATLDRTDAKVERLVLASTSGVYGDHAGATVTEETPVNPQTERAVARVAAEATVTRWARKAGVPVCTLRIAGIYGPGRLPLKAIRSRQPIIRPAEAGPGNRIHVDDLVSAFVAALRAPAPPQVVNVCDGNPLSSSDFSLEVAKAAALPPPPQVSRAEAQTTFGAMRLSFLNEQRTLDATRLTRDLGVALRYADPLAGIRASLGPGDLQG